MNKRFKDVYEYNDEIAEMFNDLPPFTITITDGYDASWLSSAMISWMAGGNDELAQRGLEVMCRAANALGVEKGVSMFFDGGIAEGHRFPKCMKPLFIHMVGHALKKYKDKEGKE